MPVQMSATERHSAEFGARSSLDPGSCNLPVASLPVSAMGEFPVQKCQGPDGSAPWALDHVKGLAFLLPKCIDRGLPP